MKIWAILVWGEQENLKRIFKNEKKNAVDPKLSTLWMWATAMIEHKNPKSSDIWYWKLFRSSPI